MTITYNYRSGRAKTLARAFRIIGAIGAGETLSSSQTSQGSQILNELIQSWSGDNLFLWALKRLGTTTTSGAITKDISALNPPVLDVEQAFVVSSTEELPLIVLTWEQYSEILDKSATGRPTHVALGSETVPTLYFYPKPDAVYTINLLASTKLADYDSTVAETEFSEQWERAMAYGVAADLADEYGIPAGERDRILGKAELAFKKAKSLKNRGLRDCNFVEGAFE